MKRFATCALFLSLALPLHGQSGIELPKPSAGALGIHFKLLQSIPYKAVSYGPYEMRFAEGGKTVVVPTLWPYQNQKNKSIDEEGLEYKVYNLVSGNPVGSLGIVRASESITSLDLSVAAACTDERLEFYRLGEGGVLKPAAVTKDKTACSLGANEPSMATLSKDGRYLAMDTDGQRIQIFESKTARLLTTLLSSDKITHLSFSSDGAMLLASEEDGTVHVWAIPSGQPIHSFDTRHAVQWADFVPGRSAIAAVESWVETFSDSPVTNERFLASVWDLRSGQTQSLFDPNSGSLSSGGEVEALTPDGRLLIAGGPYGSDGAYDLQSGARVASIDTGPRFGFYMEVAPDGTMFATLQRAIDPNYIVNIWRIERE